MKPARHPVNSICRRQAPDATTASDPIAASFILRRGKIFCAAKKAARGAAPASKSATSRSPASGVASVAVGSRARPDADRHRGGSRRRSRRLFHQCPIAFEPRVMAYIVVLPLVMRDGRWAAQRLLLRGLKDRVSAAGSWPLCQSRRRICSDCHSRRDRGEPYRFHNRIPLGVGVSGPIFIAWPNDEICRGAGLFSPVLNILALNSSVGG